MAQTDSLSPRVRQALAQHPFFSRIAYEAVSTHPYVFLVQKPGREDPRYVVQTAAVYTQLLDPTLAAFESLVAGPVGLAQRDDHPSVLVAVLASDGDYANYLGATGTYPHHAASSAYDLTLQAAVVHESPFGPARDPRERARSARHALAHVLERAYSPGMEAPVRTWMSEGLADFLAQIEVGPKSNLRPDPVALRDFVLDGTDEHWRPACLRTIAEMFEIGDSSRLADFLRSRNGLKIQESDPERASRAFSRQATLLVFYLHEGEGGRLRPALLTLLRAEFQGRPGASVLESALGESSGSFDESFLRWVIQNHSRAWPSEPIQVNALLRGAVPAAPAAAPADPEADLAAARLGVSMDDATPAERFALALHGVREGRASEGLAAIERLLASEIDPELRRRIERERDRVSSWIHARDAFLRRLLEEHGHLQIQTGGRRTRARIARIEGETLLFEPGQAGPERVEVEALDPLLLAQQMDLAHEGWIRCYPYVLGRDERWKKLLKDDEAEARLLREDAGDLGDRMRTGELAARLSELAARTVPATPSEARAWLEELATIQTSGAGSELGERKRPALSKLAAEIAGRLFDLETPWSRLHARIESLGDERLAFSYEFDDPAELEDFEAVTYVEDYRQKPLVGEHADALHVEGGELRGSGKACLRTLFDVAAPLSVRYELALSPLGPGGGEAWLNVGICDDGKEHFAWALDFHHLQVWEEKERLQAHAKDSVFYDGKVYSVELRHDGARVTLLCNGEVQQELPCTRSAGAVFLWMHSSYQARMQRLVIEGEVSNGFFGRLRGQWIERQVAALLPLPDSR